jgi:hypothetical protein
VAGTLPAAPSVGPAADDDDHPKGWASSLQADAIRFRKDRR